MRHRSGQRKLNITDGAHRIAMLRNVSNALIRHEQIKTTLIRAKELRRFVEPLITLGKKPSVANRRLVFARLRDRASVSKLFDDIGVRNAARPGGYVRILKNGYRAGDNAPMAVVELVERVSVLQEEEAAPAKAKAKATAADATNAPAAAGTPETTAPQAATAAPAATAADKPAEEPAATQPAEEAAAKPAEATEADNTAKPQG